MAAGPAVGSIVVNGMVVAARCLKGEKVRLAQGARGQPEPLAQLEVFEKARFLRERMGTGIKVAR